MAAEPASSRSESLLVHLEQGPPFTLQMTGELRKLLDLTAAINSRTKEKFDYSFSGFLLAFFVGQDEVSGWFHNYVIEAGVEIKEVLRYRNLRILILDDVVQKIEKSSFSYAQGRPTATISAIHVLDSASGFAARQSLSLDVEHLMGALIYDPKGHEGQLTDWKFDRVDWSNNFLGFIAQKHPQELDDWMKAHFKCFGKEPSIKSYAPRIQEPVVTTPEEEVKDRAQVAEQMPPAPRPESEAAAPSEAQAAAFRLSHAVARVLVISAKLSEGKGEQFPHSFTSILLGLYASDDPLCGWFQGYIEEKRINLDAILSDARVTLPEFRELQKRKDLPTGPTMAFGDGMTSSAAEILSEAERLANLTKAGAIRAIGMRGLMGAYIYAPAGQEHQFAKWGFDRAEWSFQFLLFVLRNASHELDVWINEHARVFHEKVEVTEGAHGVGLRRGSPGSAPRMASTETAAPAEAPRFSMDARRGPSAHTATDSWTVDDKLGHFAYANAIYRFITHPQTEPPLAVSIQAPWGGGKTSLMRMVQKLLDPELVGNLEADRERRRSRVQSGVPAGPLKDMTDPDAARIKHVLEEIRKWRNRQQASTPRVAPPYATDPPGGQQRPRRITVWFNAWKYESTEQVWAGLADSILRQVSERMSPLERQRFWLQLQLSRIDADKVERAILERILAEWWRMAWPWACATLALILGFFFAVIAGSPKLGWTGSIGTALVGGLDLLRRYLETDKRVSEEPAELSLGEYLQVPDYRGKVGFIHEVAEDLRRIIAAVPPEFLPLVVFIDDLDRCSPEKVAAVTEGINLFLAGEFPDCIFVLGMDPEIVAAALEEAHSEVIAKLPAYSTQTPIGWRFMDKFVQLPFMIPPPEEEDLARYVESLFSPSDGAPAVTREIVLEVEQAIPEDAPVAHTRQQVEEVLKRHNLEEPQKKAVAQVVEQKRVIRNMDRRIEQFSDQDLDIQKFVKENAPEFSHNPRDLKRFMNLFRLYDFLRIAREERGLPVPTRAQIADWIVLSLKWPQVVRWIHRAPADSDASAEGVPRVAASEESSPVELRLRQLVSCAAARDSATKWGEAVAGVVGVEAKDVPWTCDRALFDFFKKIAQQNVQEWLSAGAGKGLW